MTDWNSSDLTTKALAGDKFRRFREDITRGGGSSNGKLAIFDNINKQVVKAVLYGVWRSTKNMLTQNVLRTAGVLPQPETKVANVMTFWR